METNEVLKHFLAKEFTEFFDLVEIESTDIRIVFYLDEKNTPPKEHSDKPLESKGFADPIRILDFPIRNKEVYMHVRKRKWRDKQTGKTYMSNWDLKQEGTSYTKEFAAFLKKIYR